MANPARKNQESCCRLPREALACPVCGERGRKVGRETLDHQLAPAMRAKFGGEAGFCPNPACAVVYFDGAATVLKGETLRAVTQKDLGDDVCVCYCFGFTRGDIRKDLTEGGVTDISAKIQREIDAGRCSCERSNPQGACCLGNVVAEARRFAAELTGEP